jgi:hypothetical protein
VYGNAFQDRGIVAEQIDQSPQPLRQRRAAFRSRLKNPHRMPSRGEKVSDAVSHQAAADHCYFLYFLDSRLAHVRLVEKSVGMKNPPDDERNYNKPGTLAIQTDP